MSTKILYVMVIVSLLMGSFAVLPASAQNPTPNFYTTVSITNIAGAPVKNGIFTTDVVASVANYGGSSQVGIIGADIYITYDPAIVRFAYIEPKTGFFDNPRDYSRAECPATMIVTTTQCVHLALTQQPGSGAVYNRTGVLATLHWVGVENGTTLLNILATDSYLIQYPDNTQYPFNAITPATINIGGPGGSAGAIVGRVIRYGYIGTAAYSGPVTVTASMQGGPAVTAVADAQGYFTCTLQTGGNYSVKASYPGYLTAKRDNVYVSGATISVGETRLRGGDVNLDNYVNIFDLVMIAAWLSGSNALADINDDGYVNIYDLTLAAGSFNQHGPTTW